MKNVICKLMFIILLTGIFSQFAFSANESLPKLMLGKISYGPEAKDKITDDKIEAALFLSNQFTKKYTYINANVRDSVVQELKSRNPKFTAKEFTDSLDVSKLYFFHIDLMANMLRIQLSSTNPKTGEKSEGSGYALVHYFQERDDKAIYDPAVLKAMQRAIAVCEKDSMLFAKNDSVFYAVPAPTLVISGIDYVNNPEFSKWSLFENKELNSYFALESIFDTLKYENNIVLYDIASRDSIYSLFRLKIPENFRATNEIELACLNKLDVELIITGSFIRIENGANLELMLLKSKDNIVSLVNKINVNIAEDSKIEFKTKVQQAAVELIQNLKKMRSKK